MNHDVGVTVKIYHNFRINLHLLTQLLKVKRWIIQDESLLIYFFSHNQCLPEQPICAKPVLYFGLINLSWKEPCIAIQALSDTARIRWEGQPKPTAICTYINQGHLRKFWNHSWTFSLTYHVKGISPKKKESMTA